MRLHRRHLLSRKRPYRILNLDAELSTCPAIVKVVVVCTTQQLKVDMHDHCPATDGFMRSHTCQFAKVSTLLPLCLGCEGAVLSQH